MREEFTELPTLSACGSTKTYRHGTAFPDLGNAQALGTSHALRAASDPHGGDTVKPRIRLHCSRTLPGLFYAEVFTGGRKPLYVTKSLLDTESVMKALKDYWRACL